MTLWGIELDSFALGWFCCTVFGAVVLGLAVYLSGRRVRAHCPAHRRYRAKCPACALLDVQAAEYEARGLNGTN